MQTPENHFRKYLESIEISFNWKHETVCRTVFDIHAHFTRKQLAANLVNKIDEDELKEILNQMIEAKLVRKIVLDENKAFYEHIYGHAHHDHMLCVSCGKIIEFYSPVIESEQENVALDHKFKMLRHNLRIEGICEKCLKEGRTPVEELDTSTQMKKQEIPLTMLENGSKAIITSFNCLHWRMRRFLDMGLRIGDQIRVLKNSFDGPIKIMHGDSRMELEQGMAHRILVAKLAKDDAADCEHYHRRHCQHHRHGSRKGRRRERNTSTENWFNNLEVRHHDGNGMTLQDCREGDRVRILSVSGWGPFTRRLLEMGFVSGEEVEVKKYAPLFDPIEFIIKGSHVSLRRSEAALVRVEPLDAKEN